MKNLNCKKCGKEFLSRNGKIRCDDCYVARVEVFGNDAVVCNICSYKGKTLIRHLTKMHGLSASEYRNAYPNAVTVSKTTSEKMAKNFSGENNPGYQHGGKYSPFSKKFIKYDGEDVDIKRAELIKRRDKTVKDNPQNNPLKLEFYLHKGLSLYDARNALSKRQATFSLEKCIQKYGEDVGRQKWKERQTRWQETIYNKSQEEIDDINERKGLGKASKVSQELFKSLNRKTARYDANGGEKGIKLNNGTNVYPDFLDGNKIIEFYGDLWHANPLFFSATDVPASKISSKANSTSEDIWSRNVYRVNKLIEENYKVLIIWENDFRLNKKETIEKCLNFLNE